MPAADPPGKSVKSKKTMKSKKSKIFLLKMLCIAMKRIDFGMEIKENPRKSNDFQ